MTRSSPTITFNKKATSPVGKPIKRRARSGYQMFCHSFKEKYANDRNAAVRKYNLSDTNNLGVLQREVWAELNDHMKKKFCVIAEEEKPPVSPKIREVQGLGQRG